MKLTLSAVMFLGLAAAMLQGTPANAQTGAGSIFHVVPTPNGNKFNSGLFAASASSANDIWAVGDSTIHFDGTKWTAFPAPLINGDLTADLQGSRRYFTDAGLGGGEHYSRGQPRADHRTMERKQVGPVPEPYVPAKLSGGPFCHDFDLGE